MKRLLHINASPRRARSRSGMISAPLLAGLQAAMPALSVETIDLFEADLPPFDHDAIEGRYGLLAGAPVPADQAAAWQRLRAIADHFLSFDGWLMSVPMWNFGLPYRLKHYIDLITHPGMTFRNDADGGVEGLAAGRTAIIVAASAMPFGAMPAIDGLDFQLAYLKAWLGFIGVTDIHALRVAGTFGPARVIEAAMAKAAGEADALVAQLTARAAAV
ncbi:FMN-dependent NADH-azoreductase [Sphingomonas sp. 28-63-12]|uniref:FMN-dependent NADH-azoreductase n=1 Tax=Sphingomonas sp. 28-63-12 TaxID=1970434 RepID=UPI000BD21321|nr:MAG: NAD(P)H dehydrogenase [Sphingomonas sp. 28-63-12]